MTFGEKENLLNTYYAEILKLKTFLTSTDYQTIREFEGGAPMSDETRVKRANARARVNELEELISATKAIEPELPEIPEFPEITEMPEKPETPLDGEQVTLDGEQVEE